MDSLLIEYCKGYLIIILMELLYMIFKSEIMEETILFYDVVDAYFPSLAVLPLLPMG